MSIEFKLKLKKNIKLNIEPLKLKKMLLKVKCKDDDKKIYTGVITILFESKSDTIVIKKIYITKLELDDSSDDYTYDRYHNVYTLDNILSSSSDDKTTDMYKQLKSFAKNIKLQSEHDKVNAIIFSLKNTDIVKMKLRGKIY